jgi:glycosyltransferase involved in cell wall biosynthesis
MAEPLVTVLMAVHNGMAYLPTAVESILRQTYDRFEFLVVDDASTDGTPAWLRGLGDPRIRLVPLPRNVGQTAALNVGLRAATTPWIARMDADDFSAPTRLEEQLRALEADPAVRCLGTFAWVFREDPQVIERVVQKPLDDAGIRRELLIGTPIIHGSLIVHRETLLGAGGYDERYCYSADRELYHRLLPRCRAANLPRLLLGARRHTQQGSSTRRSAQESVQIIHDVLRARTWTRADRALLRRGLSSAYRFLGRCEIAERRHAAGLQAFGRAAGLSPRETAAALVRVALSGLRRGGRRLGDDGA